MNSNAPSRLTHLDALRGLAALAVIYAHTAEYALKHKLVGNAIEQTMFVAATQWIDLGKVAVTVFFAISGFVIPYSIFRYSERPILSFAIGRFFRLYPAYWLSIPFGLLYLFWHKDIEVSARMVLANLGMIQQFVGEQNILGIYWTLQIELVFYGICAVLFYFKKLSSAKSLLAISLFFLFIALAMSVFRYALNAKLPVALPLALTVMLWGLAARNHLQERKSDWRIPYLTLTLAIVGAMPAISLLAYNIDMGFKETWHKYLLTYYIAIAIFFCFVRYVRLRHPIFVFLGRISYSVYLFGFIVQEALITYTGHALFSQSAHLFILATAAITIAVAFISYRFVEAPGMRFGKYLSRYVTLSTSSAAMQRDTPRSSK